MSAYTTVIPYWIRDPYYIDSRFRGNDRKGFTLVELLVVISIIAILSVIGITVFSSVQKGARDARRKGDLHAISLALEQYKATTGTYPATGGWVYSDSASTPWITGLDTGYMTSVALDPQNSGGSPTGGATGGYTYGYYTETAFGGTNGSYFMLAAHLESPNSADKKTQCTLPNGAVYGSSDACAAGAICDNSSTSCCEYTDTFLVCNQQ